MRFPNRRQAGRELARRLRELLPAPQLADAMVLALPRGGVVVAAEVAAESGLPLDILTVRKIGLPGQPEFGIGAIAGEDPALFDRRALGYFDLTEDDLAGDVERTRAELRRRERRYRDGRAEPQVGGRTVILVDDGLATGITALAAAGWLRRRGPARVVMAAPVGSREAVEAVGRAVDDVICLLEPPELYAVGWWYDDFGQVSDEEVDAAMAEATRGS